MLSSCQLSKIRSRCSGEHASQGQLENQNAGEHSVRKYMKALSIPAILNGLPEPE
jgi:hypothetical protein